MAKSKTREIATLRKKKTGDTYLVFDSKVKIMFDGQEIMIDPKYKSLDITKVEKEIKFLEKLLEDNKLGGDVVSRKKEFYQKQDVKAVIKGTLID